MSIIFNRYIESLLLLLVITMVNICSAMTLLFVAIICCIFYMLFLPFMFSEKVNRMFVKMMCTHISWNCYAQEYYELLYWEFRIWYTSRHNTTHLIDSIIQLKSKISAIDSSLSTMKSQGSIMDMNDVIIGKSSLSALKFSLLQHQIVCNTAVSSLASMLDVSEQNALNIVDNHEKADSMSN